MLKRPVYALFFLCLALRSFGQTGPQIIPVLNTRKSITSVRILDTINTGEGKPIIVNSRVGVPEIINTYPPNYLGKSMMTPTAWGSEEGGYVFAGLAGSFPQIYTARPDLMSVLGLAAGNPRKAVGVIVMMNMNDVTSLNNYSTNIILHRRLSDADAVAVGGVHMLAAQETDAPPSFFFVYSHAVQNVIASDEDISRLQYSIGAGTGRFYRKSLADQVRRGKSLYGTAVFANVSYGLTKWLNVNAEWSGINLHTSISVRPAPGLPGINLGLADLTRNSGDRIRVIAAIHYAYALWD
jgi:hypothetical protein